MHIHTLENWQHKHDFAVINEKGESRTRQVLVLTAVTMVIEIIAGTVYGSMALLADGWHMATHVAAFAITIFAYRYARRHNDNPDFAFGTGKVSVLGGYTSAVVLAVVALIMLIESAQRLVSPHVIHYNEAIAIASFGLLINIVSAFLLKDHHHEHEHHDDHDHHHDHNLRAAYMHVLADALTSLLAIIALICGKYFSWGWMDPVMGMVGAIVITRWSWGLLKQTSPVLLDGSIGEKIKKLIREKIESDSDNLISDLHVWKVGPQHYAVVLSIVTHHAKTPEYYKGLLSEFNELSHVTIEVNHCDGDECLAKG